MKYISLSLLLLSSIFLIPVAQSAYAQNGILDEISQALDRFASPNSQSTSNATLPNATNNTIGSGPRNSTVNAGDDLSSKVGNGTQIAVTTIGEALKGSGEYLNDTSESFGSIIGK